MHDVFTIVQAITVFTTPTDVQDVSSQDNKGCVMGKYVQGRVTTKCKNIGLVFLGDPGWKKNDFFSS